MPYRRCMAERHAQYALIEKSLCQSDMYNTLIDQTHYNNMLKQKNQSNQHQE